MLRENDPRVLGIRDSDTVLNFQKALSGSRRIVIVGNGGIATELVYELENIEIIWVIRDEFIAKSFIDPGAAEFFLQSLRQRRKDNSEPSIVKRHKYTSALDGASRGERGTALGPDWERDLQLRGLLEEVGGKLTLETGCEIKQFLKNHPSNEYPVWIELTNGKVLGTDLVVSATGVTPFLPKIASEKPDVEYLASDGSLIVDEWLQSPVFPGLYAAGDACTVRGETGKHWFQMRLWSQAKQQGALAAHSMAVHETGARELVPDLTFEVFAHATEFFGFKVVLLGLFNAQGLPKDECEVLVRVTPGDEFVKVVLQEGKMQGALLIGETNLEETFENLILNQLDLTALKDNLLDPAVDIEDYFD